MSVHQVGFNFNLFKMHGEYNIKKRIFMLCVYCFTCLFITKQ
jgi:hypothetical protein